MPGLIGPVIQPLVKRIQAPGLAILVIAPRFTLANIIAESLVNFRLTIGMKFNAGNLGVCFFIQKKRNLGTSIRVLGDDLLNRSIQLEFGI